MYETNPTLFPTMNSSPAASTAKQITTPTVVPVAVKIEPGTEEDKSIEGEGLTIAGFKTAVEKNDKAALKVYGKVLSKSNKKQSRKPDHPSRINPWNAHVASFRAANPGMKFKEVLQQAKASYKK